MTIVGEDLKFVNGRICVEVRTVANGKILAVELQDVTPAVAEAISMYIRNDT